MSFEGASILIAGLAKIDLPHVTLRLCDGGFVIKDGEQYRTFHEDFGTIAAIEPISESTGDSLPEGRMMWLPASSAAAAALSSPAYQNSSIQLWLAQVDPVTHQVIHAEDMFRGLLNQTTLRRTRGNRVLEMSFLSRWVKLFLINEGNDLSSAAHQRVFPGELGFDNMTGLQPDVAWGTAGPPMGYGGSVGGYGGGGGGGFDLSGVNFV